MDEQRLLVVALVALCAAIALALLAMMGASFNVGPVSAMPGLTPEGVLPR